MYLYVLLPIITASTPINLNDNPELLQQQASVKLMDDKYLHARNKLETFTVFVQLKCNLKAFYLTVWSVNGFTF